KSVAQVLDRALDLALLVSAPRCTRPGGEMIVAGELENTRVIAHVLAGALEHDALEIVVEQHARRATEGLEGFDVAADEALERLVEREACIQRPTEAQYHDEARQRALGRADAHLTEARPIDLALLARQRDEVEVRLGLRHRAHRTHEAPHDDLAAGVAAPGDHAEDAR